MILTVVPTLSPSHVCSVQPQQVCHVSSVAKTRVQVRMGHGIFWSSYLELCNRMPLWIGKYPDINPIYDGLGRSCPRESKNVSFVDAGLV